MTRNISFHLGGAYRSGDVHTFTPDVWGWLLVEFDIRSVVDIGCGYGQNLMWFRDQGCEVTGIEGDVEAINGSELPPGVIIEHDYTKGPFHVGRYDLCLATEFVEHVEQKYEDNWIATTERAKYFLMCHAIPGQGGNHHVNEQTSEYWEDRLAYAGWRHASNITHKFRKTCERIPAPWGRTTLMFFVR